MDVDQLGYREQQIDGEPGRNDIGGVEPECDACPDEPGLPPRGDPFGMLVHARVEALGCGGPAGTLASSGDEAVLAHRSHCTVSIFCR